MGVLYDHVDPVGVESEVILDLGHSNEGLLVGPDRIDRTPALRKAERATGPIDPLG